MMSYTDHYTSRVVDEYQAAFDSGMADPFCSGKLAMLIQTNAYRAAIKQNAPDLNYGILQMPEMTEGGGAAGADLLSPTKKRPCTRKIWRKFLL